MSMSLKKEILDKYKNNISTFIETGTHMGGSIQLAINSGFNKIYSIDISTKYKKYCDDSYKNYIDNKQVELLYGDTIDILPTLLNNINEPILFWLDAHYDGNSDICGKFICPLFEELKLIKNSKLNNHIILIDDIRMFIKQMEWGVGFYFDEIIKYLKEININYKFGFENSWIENDILIAYN